MLCLDGTIYSGYIVDFKVIIKIGCFITGNSEICPSCSEAFNNVDDRNFLIQSIFLIKSMFHQKKRWIYISIMKIYHVHTDVIMLNKSIWNTLKPVNIISEISRNISGKIQEKIENFKFIFWKWWRFFHWVNMKISLTSNFYKKKQQIENFDVI